MNALLAAEGNAQEKSLKDIYLTIGFDQSTLLEVFDAIESMTEFEFSYYRKDLPDTKLTIDRSKRSLALTLYLVAEQAGLKFKRVDENIFVSLDTDGRTKKKGEPLIIEAVEISGTVTDENGEGLPGVNVLIKGTSQGTVTDINGNYTLTVPGDATTLVFSYVGFVQEEVQVAGRTVIDLQLVPDISTLTEVVVVGYGTEIKRNLTSSVASVNTEELQEIPNTNLSNAIAGRIAGVAIASPGGRPGNASSINIRGATTGPFTGSAEPLYVIDNVIATKELFDLLDVNEVDDVAVLKDAAAAAIYGSRASNGVILVTTKSGKSGQPRIQVTSTVGTSELTREVEHLTAYEHALLVNQSVRFGNEDPADAIPPSLFGEIPITEGELDYLRNNQFENFSKQSEQNPIVQRHAVNISGGSDAINYFVAGSYVNEQGNVRKLNYEKYNIRAKLEAHLSEDLRVSLNADLSADDNFRFFWPFDPSASLSNAQAQGVRRGNWAPAYINGLPVANFNAFNVSNFFDNASLGDETTKTNVNNFIVTLDYKIPVVEGLSAGFTYNNRVVSNRNNTIRVPTVDYIFATDPDNRFRLTEEVVGTRVQPFGGDLISNSSSRDQSYQANLRVNYDRTFGDHGVKASFIYEQTEGESEFFSGVRRFPISREIPFLFATSPDADDRNVTGSGSEFGRVSYIGSLNYSFRDRYFLTATVRSDASTRFREDLRYGQFPSVSVGWIVSDELFFGDGFGVINFLKARASYGRTGNDNVAGQAFPYLVGFNQGDNFVFGDNNANGLVVTDRGLPTTELTWDKTDSYNYGIDFELFGSKFSGSIDYFRNNRFDLFGGRSALTPISIGANPPAENYGRLEVQGIDVILSYQNVIGDFSYKVGANFGYAKNKVTEFDEAESLRAFERQTGTNTGRIFGFVSNGIIRTQEHLNELIASGYTFNGQQPYLGGLWYQDIRGNVVDDPEGNTPDGVVDANDQTLLADFSAAPLNYGITLELKYKNFSLSAFAQGFAGHKRFLPDNARFAFDVPEEGAWAHWTDAFDPVDNPGGSMPRWANFWGVAFNHNFANSTFWLRDADFLRLKNLNIGYDMPKAILSKVGINQAKVFFNGTNLFIIHSAIKEFDPEIGDGNGIPPLRSYSLGLQITI